MDHNDSDAHAGSPAADATPGGEDIDRRRRELLTRVGTAAAYAAPATLTLLSMKAHAY